LQRSTGKLEPKMGTNRSKQEKGGHRGEIRKEGLESQRVHGREKLKTHVQFLKRVRRVSKSKIRRGSINKGLLTKRLRSCWWYD